MSIDMQTIEGWIARASEAGIWGEDGLIQAETGSDKAEALVYRRSVKQSGKTTFAMLKVADASREGPVFSWDRLLGIFAPGDVLKGFEGQAVELSRGKALFAPLSHANAEALRRTLPFTAPSALADQPITFGTGDRLGSAGPGHLRAMAGYRVCPVLAQQSVRELELTGRDYGQVLDAATWAVFQEGYEGPWGADGDHLKSEEWVRTALQIGFTFITADVSDYIRNEYAAADEDEVLAAYERIRAEERKRIEDTYLPLAIELDTGERIRFTREILARTVLIYAEAIRHALRLYRAGVEIKAEGAFDFELSVDETETPTTPEAHLFVALEAQRLEMKIGSIAPRFVGEFQKGIDYIGDTEEFRRTFATHAALARHFGHRVSVHSGSDKFSVFPIVGELTGGRFHIKTAGTHWLEAMKTIAAHEPQLYRRLHRAALERFEAARRYYVVTTDLDKVPSLDEIADADLPSLFEKRDSRQLIHITYGELLKDEELGPCFYDALHRHREAYCSAVELHTKHHLESLGVLRSGS